MVRAFDSLDSKREVRAHTTLSGRRGRCRVMVNLVRFLMVGRVWSPIPGRPAQRQRDASIEGVGP